MLKGKVPSRACARGADSVGRSPFGASVSIEVCWSFCRPSSRRSCHIAVRHPVARSFAMLRSRARRGATGHGDRSAVPSGCHRGENATGAVVPVDFDHLANAAGFSRQAVGAEALPVRTFPLCEMPTDSAFPWAPPLRDSRVLSGKPERARSSRYGTLPVPLLHRRPCRRVVVISAR